MNKTHTMQSNERISSRCLCLVGLVGALLFPGAVEAQALAGQHALTLQDAIAMAQRQGPDAQIARSARSGVRYRHDAFDARLRPQLFLQGTPVNLNHSINPIVLPDGTTQFVGQEQNTSNFTIGFSQLLPLTGGTVSVSSGLSRLDLFGVNSARYYVAQPLSISLSQDLLKPRTALWTNRLESLNFSMAERSYLDARETAAMSAVNAFFDLYVQERTLADALVEATVNDTLYTLNQGRYQVGKISENDLLKSDLALLRIRAAVEDARLARDLAETTLRRTLAYPAGQPLSIVTPDSIPVVTVTPEMAVAEALRYSSVTGQMKIDAVNSKLAIAQARANSGLTATLSASVGYNQTAGAFGPAYQNPLGSQSVNLSVNLPLLQWGAGHADVAAAKADAEGTAMRDSMQRVQLVENARGAVLQLQQAQRNIGLAAKADTIATKEFDVAHRRYIVGKITNTDLYAAQAERDAAVTAYMQALRNYWTAYYNLRHVTLYNFAKKQPLSDAWEE
ncbi:MAG TPA: TolC family protein [Gemmatimonadaceae bacterium]|jgi:outer membrane protein TolC|nr:TolC family protein [Gemmatimonadaceae bacterium]